MSNKQNLQKKMLAFLKRETFKRNLKISRLETCDRYPTQFFHEYDRENNKHTNTFSFIYLMRYYEKWCSDYQKYRRNNVQKISFSN